MTRGEEKRLNAIRSRMLPNAQDAHYRECARAAAPMVQHPPMAELVRRRPPLPELRT